MGKQRLDIERVDFGIITIREDEFEAVLRQFAPFGYVKKRRRYEIASLKTLDHKEVSTAIVRCDEQGRCIAQQVATDLIEDLKPQCLMLVGICGATPSDDFTLGDVVCANRVHDYSVRACIEGKGDSYSVSGGPMHRTITDFLASLLARKPELEGWNSVESVGMAKPTVVVPSHRSSKYYGDSAWKKKVHDSLTSHFRPGESARPPRFTARSVVSSDALVKSTSLLEQWQDSSRDAASVEMELGGVYIAANRHDGQVPILAVRGISDIVGFRRENIWTTYACNSAAAFALAVLRAGASALTAEAPSDDVRDDVQTAASSPRANLSEASLDAQMVTLSLRILEEKKATEANTVKIVDAGVFLWQEADADCFWLRIFFLPGQPRVPRLKIICNEGFEVRDFSHAFLADDNLLWVEQRADLTEFQKDRLVVTRAFYPRPGEETNRNCCAHSIPIVAEPLRAHIERAIDTIAYVEPRDFLTYETISRKPARDGCVFGLWLFCRLARRVVHTCGTLDFQISSNMEMDFFRFQAALPHDINVAFDECSTSDNLFMPWVNSNPLVALPGWISLASVSGRKNISVCYTIVAPFLQGRCTLVYHKPT